MPNEYIESLKLKYLIERFRNSRIRHLIGLLLEIGLAEFENHCKIDGLYTDATWFLIEVFLLEDLKNRVNKQIHQSTASQTYVHPNCD